MLPEGSFTSALLLDGLVNLGWGEITRVYLTHEGIKSKVHPGQKVGGVQINGLVL